MDFGITKGVQDRTPIFLAIKVLFRIAQEEIKMRSYSVGGLHQSSMKSGIF